MHTAASGAAPSVATMVTAAADKAGGKKSWKRGAEHTDSSRSQLQGGTARGARHSSNLQLKAHGQQQQQQQSHGKSGSGVSRNSCVTGLVLLAALLNGALLLATHLRVVCSSSGSGSGSGAGGGEAEMEYAGAKPSESWQCTIGLMSLRPSFAGTWAWGASAKTTPPRIQMTAHKRSGARLTSIPGEPNCTYSDVLWERVRRTPVTPADLAALAAASPRFADPALADPARLHAILQLVKHYLHPWEPLVPAADGAAAGAAGTTSQPAWTVAHVHQAVATHNLMGCCIHVRVVRGRVLYRHGEPVTAPWRLTRAHGFVRALQRAVDAYALRALRLDLLYNTCVDAMSARASVRHSGRRANVLAWGPYATDATADVPVPDALGLDPGYYSDNRTGGGGGGGGAGTAGAFLPWAQRASKLVFRGATTNFRLHHANWCTSPRVRLHRMTDGAPELLDLRLSRWSHATPGATAAIRAGAGVALAPPMGPADLARFKYELDAAGAMGSCRMCGVVAAGGRLLVRQAGPVHAFFDPLMRRGRHFVEVRRSPGADVPRAVAHLRARDAEAARVVRAARDEVAWTCTARANALALAVMLVRYQGLLLAGAGDRAAAVEVEEPAAGAMCAWGPMRRVERAVDEGAQEACARAGRAVVLERPGCPTVCSALGLPPDQWVWLAARDLPQDDAPAGAAGFQQTS